MAELYKEEYQTLRKEVETAMSELNTLETGALAAVAAIFAWLVTHTQEGVLTFGWLLPAVLVAFCMLRAYSIGQHLAWLGEYIKKYESAYLRPQLPGWEHFLSDPPEPTPAQADASTAPAPDVPRKLAGKEKPRKARRGVRGRITHFFWVALFLASVVGGYVGHRDRPTAQEVKSPK